MIHIEDNGAAELSVVFGGEELGKSLPKQLLPEWEEGFGAALVLPRGEGLTLFINRGDAQKLSLIKIKELLAVAVKRAKKLGVKACSLEATELLKSFGRAGAFAAAEGVSCGLYSYSQKSEEKKKENPSIYINPGEGQSELFLEALCLSEEISFAKDLVNTPGNRMRPHDLVKAITERVKSLPIEVLCMDYEQLVIKGLEGLAAVGRGSEFKPYLLVLRYTGAPENGKRLGLAGKGITCDTGGYCIKGAKSMLGIKGDMAGAAAVAAAVSALAKNKLPVNVTACLPIAENRISPDAMLPGDVIKMYNGKTVEILNTDAEGRLILADAVAYLDKNERVDSIVDIATLTGAAWSAMGYTMSPALSDSDTLYSSLQRAAQLSAERFVRFPFFEEHEKMIESKVADIKNMGGDCCGTITAGLFIRQFAGGLPWLHLDIAGTAWADTPSFKHEAFGATGAGAATLYHLAAGCLE